MTHPDCGAGQGRHESFALTSWSFLETKYLRYSKAPPFTAHTTSGKVALSPFSHIYLSISVFPLLVAISLVELRHWHQFAHRKDIISTLPISAATSQASGENMIPASNNASTRSSTGQLTSSRSVSIAAIPCSAAVAEETQHRAPPRISGTQDRNCGRQRRR